MISTHGLRVLRPHTARPAFYNEKLMDELIGMQIDGAPKPHPRGRPRGSSSSSASGSGGGLARELDVEALIAIAVGFPVESLTEEEIESNECCCQGAGLNCSHGDERARSSLLCDPGLRRQLMEWL